LQHIKISEIFSEVQNPIILCGVLYATYGKDKISNFGILHLIDYTIQAVHDLKY